MGHEMTEFWRYSSRNRAKHEPHPRVKTLREVVLIYWAAGWTQEAIAYWTDLHVDTVNAHLRRARKAGDPRALVRHAATLHAMAAAQ